MRLGTPAKSLWVFGRMRRRVAEMAVLAILSLGSANVLQSSDTQDPAGRSASAVSWKLDLTIGGDNEGGVVFGRIEDLAVDADGGLYVIDNGMREVKVFDGSGQYVGSVGRAGEAPGEFDFPTAIAAGDGRLFVADMGRIEIFRLPGLEILDGFQLSKTGLPVRSLAIDSEANIYTVSFEVFDQLMIHKYTPQFEHTSSFGKSFGFDKDLDVFEETTFAGGYISIAPGNIIVYAQMYPYKLEKYTTAGDLISSFGRPEGFLSPYIHEQDSAGTMKSGLPDAITGVCSLSNGSVVISTVKTAPEGDNSDQSSIMDHYAEDGSLIGTWELPGRVLVRASDAQDRVYLAIEDGIFRIERWAVVE